MEKIALGGPWGFKWEGYDVRGDHWFPTHAGPIIGTLCRACAVFRCSTLPRDLPDYLEDAGRYVAWDPARNRPYEVKIDTYAWVLHAPTTERVQEIVLEVQRRAAEELRKRGKSYGDDD